MAQFTSPIPGLQTGGTLSLGNASSESSESAETLYDPKLLKDVLAVKNQDDVIDEYGAVNIRTMSAPKVKSKTVLHRQVLALEPQAYAQFVRDGLKKLASYSKTVTWFTRQITQASADRKCLTAVFNGEEYEFGKHDIGHIQKLYQNALSNLKIIFRTSKKTVRKSKSGTASTNVYGKLCMSQPFQFFVENFLTSLHTDLYTNFATYQSLSRSNASGEEVKIVDDDMIAKAANGTNYFVQRTPEHDGLKSFIRSGFVRKLTASSSIYIAGYISNIAKLKSETYHNLMEPTTEEGRRLQAEFKAKSIEELKAAKKRYLGGTFAAPPYMVAAFGKGANWDANKFTFGRHNHTHATCKIVKQVHDKFPSGFNAKGIPVLKYAIVSDPNNPNTVFEEMENAQQVDNSTGTLVNFSKDSISMNLVGRIVSLVTFAAKDKAEFEKVDPTVGQAFDFLNKPELDAALEAEMGHMINISHFYRRVHSYYAFDRSQSLKYITSIITSKTKRKPKATA